jgi:hypothetical protein
MHAHSHSPHKANKLTNAVLGGVQIFYGIISGDVLTAALGGHNAGDALTHGLRDKADSEPDPAKRRKLGMAAGASLVAVAACIAVVEHVLPTRGTITSATQAFAGADVGMNGANATHTYYAAKSSAEQKAALLHTSFDATFSLVALTSTIVALQAKFTEFQSACVSYGHLAALAGLGVYEMRQAAKEYHAHELSEHYVPFIADDEEYHHECPPNH